MPSNRVTADYFRAMRIPLVAGRTFTDDDGRDAIVISRALANRYWPNGDAVGHALKLFANGEWESVVGVVGDVEGRAGGIASPLYIYRRLAPPSGNSGNVPRTRGYATRVMVVRANDAAAAVPAMQGRGLGGRQESTDWSRHACRRPVRERPSRWSASSFS